MGICVDQSPAVLPVCRGYPWGLWSEADVGKGERGCGQPRRPDQVLKHFHPCLTSKCISLLQVSMCFVFFSQSSPPPVNLLGAGGRVCVCVCVSFIPPHSSPGVNPRSYCILIHVPPPLKSGIMYQVFLVLCVSEFPFV